MRARVALAISRAAADAHSAACKVPLPHRAPLVRGGANIETKAERGLDALQLAAEKGHQPVVDELLKLGAKPSKTLVRVAGMQRHGCNGLYAQTGRRDGKASFDKANGHPGCLYFDRESNAWKCCASGRSRGQTGWNYSQRPSPRGLASVSREVTSPAVPAAHVIVTA